MKHTAFFSTAPTSEQFRQMTRGPNDYRKFINFFRGVRMQIIYDPRRTFLFGGLSQYSTSDARYKVKGQTIPEYMRASKNISVALTTASGVHPGI